MTVQHILASALTVVMLSSTLSAAGADIEITIKNVEDEKGQIYASLCGEDAYLAQRYDQCSGIRFTAKEDAVGVFQDIAPGTYSVTVFQDLDGDGTLKTGGQRIPLEPLGSSNDARGRFGPPSFDDLAVEHDDQKTSLVITLYSLVGTR